MRTALLLVFLAWVPPASAAWTCSATYLFQDGNTFHAYQPGLLVKNEVGEAAYLRFAYGSSMQGTMFFSNLCGACGWGRSPSNVTESSGRIYKLAAMLSNKAALEGFRIPQDAVWLTETLTCAP